jgi:hypothetical protein
VISNFNKLQELGGEAYQRELNEKICILERMIAHYDDGRKKGFYCLAVNLLPLPILRNIMEKIGGCIDSQNIDKTEKISQIVALFGAEAKNQSIELKLRK